VAAPHSAVGLAAKIWILAMTAIDARTYLRRLQLGLTPDWTLSAPEDLLDLASWYSACGDARSALGCVCLFTAIKHPPPEGCPTTVELGREVLDAWLEARAWR
jgi:hypothetical protein